MTNLNKLVTSLELSKRLKELNVSQESLFYWKEYDSDGHLELMYQHRSYSGLEMDAHKSFIAPRFYSAYTAGELSEWQRNVDSPEPWPADGSWWWYKNEEEIEADTQVNAYAARGIYLLTSNLINVKG